MSGSSCARYWSVTSLAVAPWVADIIIYSFIYYYISVGLVGSCPGLLGQELVAHYEADACGQGVPRNSVGE